MRLVAAIFRRLGNYCSASHTSSLCALRLMLQVFVALFTLEMVLKVIAFGFIANGKLSYMRNNWNVMDFIVVCARYVGLRDLFFSASVHELKIQFWRRKSYLWCRVIPKNFQWSHPDLALMVWFSSCFAGNLWKLQVGVKCWLPMSVLSVL